MEVRRQSWPLCIITLVSLTSLWPSRGQLKDFPWLHLTPSHLLLMRALSVREGVRKLKRMSGFTSTLWCSGERSQLLASTTSFTSWMPFKFLILSPVMFCYLQRGRDRDTKKLVIIKNKQPFCCYHQDLTHEFYWGPNCQTQPFHWIENCRNQSVRHEEKREMIQI